MGRGYQYGIVCSSLGELSSCKKEYKKSSKLMEREERERKICLECRRVDCGGYCHKIKEARRKI